MTDWPNPSMYLVSTEEGKLWGAEDSAPQICFYLENIVENWSNTLAHLHEEGVALPEDVRAKTTPHDSLFQMPYIFFISPSTAFSHM